MHLYDRTNMRKIIAICVFLAAGFYIQAQTLSWDIRFLKGEEMESLPISQIIRMETGEIFWICIESTSDCYCYVVSYDSQRQISVVYDELLEAGDEIRLGYFRIANPPGTETLYVLMSLQRQTLLETLIQNLNANPDSRQHADNLRREVFRLQNDASSLGDPASSFIASGGTSRGNEGYVTRFSEKDLYVRTIVIRH